MCNIPVLPLSLIHILMERKTVSLSTVHNIVMDEADEMLNMGFTDSINAILADVPKERNTLLFSATMSPEIARISKNYLQNAKEITIGRKNESTSNVKHVAYTVQAKDKYAACLLYTSTRRRKQKRKLQLTFYFPVSISQITRDTNILI